MGIQLPLLHVVLFWITVAIFLVNFIHFFFHFCRFLSIFYDYLIISDSIQSFSITVTSRRIILNNSRHFFWLISSIFFEGVAMRCYRRLSGDCFRLNSLRGNEDGGVRNWLRLFTLKLTGRFKRVSCLESTAEAILIRLGKTELAPEWIEW